MNLNIFIFISLTKTFLQLLTYSQGVTTADGAAYLIW